MDELGRLAALARAAEDNILFDFQRPPWPWPDEVLARQQQLRDAVVAEVGPEVAGWVLSRWAIMREPIRRCIEIESGPRSTRVRMREQEIAEREGGWLPVANLCLPEDR